LPTYITDRRVGRALVKSLRRDDTITIGFLLDSGLLARFHFPMTQDKLRLLKTANEAQAKKSGSKS
jgi:hypothetical protein